MSTRNQNLPDDCQPGSYFDRIAPWNQEDPRDLAESAGLRLCSAKGCELAAPEGHMAGDTCPVCYLQSIEDRFVGPDAHDEDSAALVAETCAVCGAAMNLAELLDHVDSVHACEVRS